MPNNRSAVLEWFLQYGDHSTLSLDWAGDCREAPDRAVDIVAAADRVVDIVVAVDTVAAVDIVVAVDRAADIVADREICRCSRVWPHLQHHQ